MDRMKGQGSLNGWLTTKKRGRDDTTIASDRKRALAARKKVTAAKPKTTTTTTTKKKKKKSKNDVLDDNDDEDDDVVIDDDDDDDDDDDKEEEEEDDDTSIDDFVVNDSDSDNASHSFLPSHKSRSSRPSKALQKATIASKKPRVNPIAIGLSGTKKATCSIPTPALKSKLTLALPSKSKFSSTSKSTSTLVPASTRKPRARDGAPLSWSSSSSSSSLDGNLTSPSKNLKKKSPRLRKFAQVVTRKVTPDDTSDEDSLPPSSGLSASIKDRQVQEQPKPQPPLLSQPPKGPRDSLQSLRSPTTPSRDKSKETLASLEDTPEPVHKKLQQKINPKNKNRFAAFQHPVYDSATDEDERIALRAALKASLQPTKQQQSSTLWNDDSSVENDLKIRQRQKIKNKSLQLPSRKYITQHRQNDLSDDEQHLASEELLNHTSDEGEEEEEDANDAYNEEQKVATSILKTAETLSAKVLNSMLAWSQQDQSATGLIVDGAISLGNVQDTTSHKWIPQEVMKQACPGVTLSNYQLIGVNWLALLHGMDCQIEGKDTPVNGVLADEMGLGKTVQTIAFLAWLKYQNPKEHDGPHLIAVPVSVLPNWMREFKTFCPEMNVVKYHGSQAEREQIQEELRQYLPTNNSKTKTLDVILVPVTYYQKEKSDDRKFLNKFRFNYLVVDEAHMLKNAQSTRYRMLDRIKTQHRLLLTGTPVQNSPQELLNMLCFIMPLFSKGSENMDEGVDNVGDRMLQHFVDAEMEQNGDEQVAYKKLKQLFAPFVLRRKKEDVISQLLPAKERLIEYVDLDSNGRIIYDSILEAHVQKNGTKLTAAIGDHLFTNLRKAAHHPLLLRTRHNTPSEIEHLNTYFHKYGAFQGEGSTITRVAEEVSKYNDFQIHLTALELIEENPHRRNDLERYILDEEALFSSAKFVRLRSLLPQLVKEGHRVLIFSGWTSCLDLLGCLMEHLELKYLRMDGSCASDVRQQMIDEFNQDDSINVFLLSTRACGLGINLTSADTCIMHDLDFNPFNDLQAEDRCHRIGQTRKVTIYKMVTKDTVDADIYEMQERKAKMNAAIMESNEAKKERKVMLQAVVDRFLKSPKKRKKEICVL